MAHFEPDTITLTGEGVFPRISFNLPREVTSENYSRLRKKALKNLLPAGGLLPAGDRDAANEDSQEEITVSGQHVHVLYDASPVACTLALPSLNLVPPPFPPSILYPLPSLPQSCTLSLPSLNLVPSPFPPSILYPLPSLPQSCTLSLPSLNLVPLPFPPSILYPLPSLPQSCAPALPSLNLQLFVPPPDLECEIERLMVVEVAQKHLDKMHGAGRKPSRPR